MIEVQVRHYVSQGYELTFPYDARIVQIIKARVHKDQRVYDAAKKVWWLMRWTDLRSVENALKRVARFRHVEVEVRMSG